ncbi:MAG: MBOAT family protein [Clostridia bacterium]|nr:MBOAT family protein [Clostridia bacterium]
MVFSSLTFLLLFMPIVLGLYFIKKSMRWRNGVLLVVSLLFYAWGEPLWIFAMVASALVNWICASVIDSSENPKVKKAFLAAGVFFAGALLFACKYSTFFANTFLSIFGAKTRLKGFALPIGISFYTFQIISYTVDVYREEVKAQKSFWRLLLYVSCFPQLIAGPIVRYSDVAQEIGKRKTTPDDFSAGMQRFIVGLGKKVIFANILGMIMKDLPMAGSGAALSLGGAWYAAFVYMLQVYFDFSGYSDMAIGIGRILGFHYRENFDHPLVSLSAGEFWRRWHISLGDWFREYLMYPIMRSGWVRKLSMKKSAKHGRMFYRNLATIIVTMIVWTFTGMWHGANWCLVLWGEYYGIMMVLEKFAFGKALDKTPKPLRWLLNFIVAVVSFAIFYYSDVGDLGKHLAAMVGAGGGGLLDETSKTVMRTYSVLPLIAFVASLPIVSKLGKWMEKRLSANVNDIARVVSLSCVLLLSLLFLVGQSVNPFIYFQF